MIIHELKAYFISVLCCLGFGVSKAQTNTLSVIGIPENLKENANSVIRNQEINIEIKSVTSLKIKKKKIVTVFNEQGLSNVDAYEHYDNAIKVISIQAIVLDAFGSEIKKIKQKDFIDRSVADGFSIFNDDRVLELDYTPTSYPFTVIFESETINSNTAFIPSWNPIDDFYESVEKSSIHITYPSDLGFKYKEKNMEGRGIEKNMTPETISFEAKNLAAEKKEEYATSFLKNVPRVIFGLDRFSLEGVEGRATSWKEFGQWMSYLIKGTDELPIETQNKVKELTSLETDPIKKAKIIYEFVQNKTRYVSIQLGIGGWKPMLAKDVDRLGYGDCKALTNYTKALLKSVGIDSYYAIIYGGEKQDIDPDFVSMQGNHAVLALPDHDSMVFLECTSQTKPFGFEGDFTDDRLALLLLPSGGELHKTKKFIDEDNSQQTTAKFSIGEDGIVKGEAVIESKGLQYDNVYAVKTLSDEKIKEYYSSKFRNINNLQIAKYKLTDRKDAVFFKEELEVVIPDYVKKMGTDFVLIPNLLNSNSSIPQRYRSRKHAFEVTMGFYDVDQVEITVPQQMKSIVTPQNVELKTKFGEYTITFELLNPTTIKYTRKLLLKQGVYEKELYEEFRSFREQIAKNDNSKIILKNG